MAVNDTLWGGYAVQGGDLPFKNTDGSNDLVAGDAVFIDTTNVITTSQPVAGVVRSTTDNAAIGVAIESIPKGKTGRVRVYGVAVARASGAVTAGDNVSCDTVGNMKTTPGGKACLGMALNTTTTLGDALMVLIDRAKNT